MFNQERVAKVMITSQISEKAISEYLLKYINLDTNKAIYAKGPAQKYLLPLFVYSINDKKSKGKLQGNTPEERFKFFKLAFVENGLFLEEIQLLFPKILDAFYSEVDNLINEVNQVKKRFKKDNYKLRKAGIIRNNSKIQNIKIKGDQHRGKSVCEVELVNGESLIYKPHNLNNEVFWNELIEKYNDFIEYESKNFVCENINKKDYGWSFKVKKHEINKAQIKNYYFRLGELLFLAYLLDLTDLHFENVISHGEFPVLLDVEALFSNYIIQDNILNDAQKKVENSIKHAVIATGLLPIKDTFKTFHGDTSGIAGGKLHVQYKKIINSNRDDIRFQTVTVDVNHTNHLPQNNNFIFNPSNYWKEIANGFENFYRITLENKKNVLDFIKNKSKGLTSRILVRNTKDYSLILELISSPKYSHCQDKIFNKLKINSSRQQKLFNQSEIKQLKLGSIPKFHQNINSKFIKDDFNTTIVKKADTLEQNIKNKFDKLTEDDLDEQLTYIKFSFNDIKKLRVENMHGFFTKNQDGNNKYGNIAVNNLSDIIMNNARKGLNNTIAWQDISVGNYDEFKFVVSDNTIYKGIAGYALPLIKLYKKYKNIEIKDILLRIRDSLINSDDSLSDISFFNGRIGELLVASRINKLFSENNSYINHKIYQYLLKINNEFYLKYDDIIAGYSGIIIGIFQNLNNIDIQIKEQLEKISDYILENANYKDEKIYWTSRDNSNSYNNSFAHGNSGVMTALLIMYSLTKKIKYYDFFKKAWKFEDDYLDGFGWEDLRKKDKIPSAYWCHGSNGILQARIEWIKLNEKFHILTKEDINKINFEIEIAKRSILSEGINQNNFCLCHGVMGCLLTLNSLSEVQGNGYLKSAVKNTLNNVCKYGLTYGWNCGTGGKYFSYGLMTGISGILYGILTLQNNDSSILSLKL